MGGMKGVTPGNAHTDTPIGFEVCNYFMVKSSVKSAESGRKRSNPHETCPEVGGVTYMPGVRYSW